MADETVKIAIANADDLAKALKNLEDLAARGEITSQQFNSQMEAIKKLLVKLKDQRRL